MLVQSLQTMMMMMMTVMKKGRRLIDMRHHRQVAQWQACSTRTAIFALPGPLPAAILAQHMMVMMNGTEIGLYSTLYGLSRMMVKTMPDCLPRGPGVLHQAPDLLKA